jgi:quercetin dioxygenase-like cupin family protein
MTPIDLLAQAQGLPVAWASSRVGQVGGASVKVLRMDGQPYPEETHAHGEVLLVLDGELRLSAEGRPLTVAAGQMVLVPAGTAHAVEPGSHGTLLIVS